MPEQKGENRRPFATGSKPGPDAVDHFLESQGFYRKVKTHLFFSDPDCYKFFFSMSLVMLHLSTVLFPSKCSIFKITMKRFARIAQTTWKRGLRNTQTRLIRTFTTTSVICVEIARMEHCWNFVLWPKCIG
jgi:hypothetical protein